MADKKPVYTETIRRVYVEGENKCLSVGPWSEVPDYLALYAEGKENRDWFGNVNLSMTSEYARKLGQALIAAADEHDREVAQNF